ncbi:uncharacterized protein H6S33_012114 [Morchella sextelata]|uniref:uncharacterized protein n=1 Tax=Morchella sextelata TaxID=1174677 RepID=UPI001D05B3DA|nr:uncharacterized protein H6S33_012114 [Morchella sextelata]KAH0610587.1 hypothetical protein H6S33_012114 [Morchella sextelata]
MHDYRSHALLQQLPLSVSPFIHLPTAVTLPYTFQTLPSTLPPASPSPPSIVSPSGAMTTTPQAVIQSCQSLVAHLQAQREKAAAEVAEWEKTIAERELNEKRRVAPGYLDTGMRMLEPVRRGGEQQQGGEGLRGAEGREGGEELDRVFGRMGV